MDEEELEKLFNYLGLTTHSNYSEIQPILVSYRELKSNPRDFLSYLSSSRYGNPIEENMTLDEFIDKISLKIDVKKWEFLQFFQELLLPDQEVYMALLTEDMNVVLRYLKYLSKKLERAFSRIISKQGSDSGVTILYLDQYKTKLSHYILHLQLISIIQDENLLLQYLLSQFSIDALYYFQPRFLSIKNQQSLQRYFIQLAYKKPPSELSIVQRRVFLEYFSSNIFPTSRDNLLFILSYIENIPTTLRHKQDPYRAIVSQIRKQDPESIVDMAYNYPRADVRNVFIPHFIEIVDKNTLRDYYQHQSSKSTKQFLLKNLIGRTSDPYFLWKILEELQELNDLRKLMNSLCIIKIDDYQEFAKFILDLLDRYNPSKLNELFGTFHSELGMLYDIIDRVEEYNLDTANKIRAKLRIVS